MKPWTRPTGRVDNSPSIGIVSPISLVATTITTDGHKDCGLQSAHSEFILTKDVGFNHANQTTQWHRSKIAQAIHLLTLAVTAAAIHVPRAHADEFATNVSAADGADGVSAQVVHVLFRVVLRPCKANESVCALPQCSAALNDQALFGP
jgi:hypothetical protein